MKQNIKTGRRRKNMNHNYNGEYFEFMPEVALKADELNFNTKHLSDRIDRLGERLEKLEGIINDLQYRWHVEPDKTKIKRFKKCAKQFKEGETK